MYIRGLKTNSSIFIRISIVGVILTASLVCRSANNEADSKTCESKLAGRQFQQSRRERQRNLQEIKTANLTPDHLLLLKEMKSFIEKENGAVRVPWAASRIRFQLDENKNIRTDAPVTVIFHGLLNSPAWFQKMEDLAFASGSHVFNIRLPGHYSKRPSDLDRVTCDEWMHSVRETLRWAKGFSENITFVGHSTGALGGIIANVEEPGLIKKMLLYSPAFQVRKSVLLKIKAVAALGLSGWIFTPPIENERYLSSWAGIEVDRLSQIAANLNSQPDFEAALNALTLPKVLWVDTQFDKTLDVARNIELANHLKEKGSGVSYILLTKDLKISHDLNGTFGFDGTGTAPLFSRVREFLQSN